jgi:hypothetical protein
MSGPGRRSNAARKGGVRERNKAVGPIIARDAE